MGKVNPAGSIRLSRYMLLGLALGAFAGWVLQRYEGAPFAQWTLAFVSLGSELFLRLLSMSVIPLVVSSVFLGITGLGSSQELGRTGKRMALLYTFTTSSAIIIGLLCVNLLRPGVGANLPLGDAPLAAGEPPSGWDLVSRIVPRNPFQALAEFDMVSIIFFIVLFAIFALQLPAPKRKPLVDLIQSIYDVMMRLVAAILILAPVGVFCIVAKLVAATGFAAFVPLAKYFFTVVLALGIHFGLLLPFLLRTFSGRSPRQYLHAMGPALLTAFSSGSSSATLPLTIECATHRARISERSASVVLPLGATVNMDGTALYEGVAVIFIAQAMGIELGLLQQLVVLFMALLVSIGAAGIPHAGLVMMVIILKAVGLPLEAAGMIWAVDRVLDMARTATNVWSDCVVAAIVDARSAPAPGGDRVQ